MGGSASPSDRTPILPFPHPTAKQTPSIPSARCRPATVGTKRVHASARPARRWKIAFPSRQNAQRRRRGPHSAAAFPPCHLPTKLIVSAEATSFLRGWMKTRQLGPPSDVRVGVYDRLGADGPNRIIANQLQTYYEPYVFY